MKKVPDAVSFSRPEGEVSMMDLLNHYRQAVDGCRALILSLPASGRMPNCEIVLSNNDLLVGCLTRILQEEKARYLPFTVKEAVSSPINQVVTSVEALIKEPQNAAHVETILQAMDRLYSNCLQYGLITFGFSGREETQRIEQARAELNEIAVQTKNLKRGVKSKNEAAEAVLARLEQDIQKLGVDAQCKLKGFEDNLQVAVAGAEGAVAKLNGMIDDVRHYKDSSEAAMQKITELHAASQQVLERAKESENQAKNASQNATTVATKINEQLQTTASHAAETKTKADAANQSLANAKQKEAEITAFYQKLEAYKAEMVEVKRQADAACAATKDSYLKTIAEYKSDTESIIEQNIEYQKQIRELLQKAVSAGLFGVFKERHELLAKGRNFWRWAVIASSFAVVAGIVFVSFNWESKPDIIFFVRLGVMVPLAFLMYFTAAQYRKERQAEEEYAFKSAISFSLEPYRDLLLTMRRSDNLEADFVKRLMEDIFDNPVPRLYSKNGEKDDEENPLGILATLMQKIPADKKNMIMDIVKQCVVGEK